jgi:hypothetical protein
MKNSLLFFVILFTIAANGFSQTSFRIEFDTYSFGATGPDVASTLDGHIAVSYANQDDDLVLMKLDTLGNVIWTNNFGIDGFNNYGYDSFELTAAMDSGFYLVANSYHDLYGWYNVSKVRKIDKNGNVQSLKKTTTSPGTIGESVSFGILNKLNNKINYSFYHDEYAGSGSSCCYSNALITVNESLTVSSKKNPVNLGHFTKFMVYDDSLNTASLGVVPDLPKGFTQIDFYDSLLNLEMYRRFYYDTTIVGGMNIIGYAQKDNSKYLLLTARLNAKSYLGIQKLDSSWNTIYTKILTPVPPDSINPTPYWNAKIGISNNGNLIIAGLYRHLGITGYSFFLSELDGAGNVLHSYRSIEDNTYTCAIDIDTLSGTALFVRKDISSSVPKLQLERQFPSSPACNFVPFPLAPTSITITDSLFASSVTTTINLLPVLNTVGAITPVNLNKIAIPKCGILSGTQGIQSDENCQTISTYAENGLYNFKLEENCYFNSGSELIIYNMYAQVVLKKRVQHTSDALNLDLSKLPTGIYLLKVEFENHSIGSSKFYKN